MAKYKPSFEVREQALQREGNRVRVIEAAFKDAPTNRELSKIRKAVDACHRLLCEYDLAETMPGLAGIAETMFDAAIARVEEVKAEAEATA